MVNRIIEIEDLQVGDEIITLSQAPKYLKIAELPRKSKTVGWQGATKYIAVKCQVNVSIKQLKRPGWNPATRLYDKTIVYENKVFTIAPPEKDSPFLKFDLNYKQLWLVKRENNI